VKRLFLVLMLAWFLLLPVVADSETQPERISFMITTLESGAGQRTVLSQALVDGPEGTDFAIHLNSQRFQMTARFLTDLLDNGNLRIRSRLNTRRFYGTSERNLPLYEQDIQRPEMELGLDEAMALLPFGQNGGAETLSIEIVPAASRRSARLPDGTVRPLEIEFMRNDQSGVISIEAEKIPHHYLIDAQVLDGEHLLFAARDRALYGEASPVVLRSVPGTGQSGEFTLKIEIDEYQPGAPAAVVGFGFDVDRSHATGVHHSARSWAGKARLGNTFDYPIKDETGRELTLRMTIRLAGK
jgi:hypothetical protein